MAGSLRVIFPLDQAGAHLDHVVPAPGAGRALSLLVAKADEIGVALGCTLAIAQIHQMGAAQRWGQ